jgi:hypothetical protein
MPGTRRPGPDHPHHPWSPLPARPALRWSCGAPLAMSVLVVLEHFEVDAPDDAVRSAWLGGGLGARPYPDVLRYAHRQYGHRVGIFRVLDALEAVGAPASVAIDAMTAEAYPWLVRHLLGRGVEPVAHGIAVTRAISGRMTEVQERAYITESLDRLEAVLGVRPVGWMGPEHGESERTPALLAEAGVGYVCDWPNDEQPYAMTVPQGDLVSLPPMLEYDDGFALSHRKMPPDSWAAMLRAGIDQLVVDGAATARHLLLTVRPWLIGQPFRIGTLEAVMAHAAASDVWFASTGDVAADFRRQSRALAA